MSIKFDLNKYDLMNKKRMTSVVYIIKNMTLNRRDFMRCPRCNIGPITLSFGLGLIVSLIFPDKFIAIIISLLVVILSYIILKCYR